MSATIEMEENKTSSNDTNDQSPSIVSHLNANASQKQKDTTFLDLSWGLGSIDLEDPYKKEYITTAYATTSFLLALLIVFIKSYALVLIIAIINCTFQCSVFLFCVYKYKCGKTAKSRISIERNLSMSVDSMMSGADSMSPSLASEYGFKYKAEELQHRKLWNKCLGFKKYHDFFASFDVTFGREDDPVFIRPYFFRFNAVLYGVITSIFALAVIVAYGDSPLGICPTSYGYDFINGIYDVEWDLSKPNIHDYVEATGVVKCTCSVYIYDFGVIYWLWFISFSLFDSYELKPAYYKYTTKIITTARKTFRENNVKELHARVENRIYEDVKSKMQFGANVGLITVLYIVWFIGLFLRLYLGDFGVISFPIIFIPMFEAMVNANISMTLFKICVLSKYPFAISNIFSEPIYCHTSNDVLAWWQLRHIYATYRMPIYIKVLTPTIFLAFVFIVLLPFWAVMSMVQNAKTGQKFYVFPVQLSITVVFIFCLLYCVKQFVAAYEKQNNHIGMLQKERIRLEVNKDNFADIKNLIQLISEHMAQFDKPIYIAGIPMTNGVFTLLRGAFSGIALLIVAEMVNSS